MEATPSLTSGASESWNNQGCAHTSLCLQPLHISVDFLKRRGPEAVQLLCGATPSAASVQRDPGKSARLLNGLHRPHRLFCLLLLGSADWRPLAPRGHASLGRERPVGSSSHAPRSSPGKSCPHVDGGGGTSQAARARSVSCRDQVGEQPIREHSL